MIFSLICLLALVVAFQRRRLSTILKLLRYSQDDHARKYSDVGGSDLRTSLDGTRELGLLKELYFKLQSIEYYPKILPKCRDLLLNMFSETLTDAYDNLESRLLEFLRVRDAEIAEQWTEYLVKRRQGMTRQMFLGRSDARLWLKQNAPLRYVDGAWLGHINHASTPFNLRTITKSAWQVLSEEYGGGDLAKHHVYVYRQLMQNIAPDLPRGDSIDFLHPRHGLTDLCVWRTAILGFNLHFECLSLQTLMAAKELKELGFNAYYFFLHITIDNADSGHTAIAMEAVDRYLELVRATKGDVERIQVGFCLSNGIGKVAKSRSPSEDVRPTGLNEIEARVIDIFRAKLSVVHGIHHSSRATIGNKALSEWLRPESLETVEGQRDFLENFGDAQPWIYKGDSEKSIFVKELLWGGKMFGSFTQDETDTVRRWINYLGSKSSGNYWKFIGKDEPRVDQLSKYQDISTDYPVFLEIPNSYNSVNISQMGHHPLSAGARAEPNMKVLLPLWFTHQCLLQGFLSAPSKTTTTIHCAIIRLLRAQYGFGPETPIVSGMDETRRKSHIGLIEIGLELTQRAGFGKPGSLQDVMKAWPSEVALAMLHWSMRPIANKALLIGLSWGFLDLHEFLASSILLSEAGEEFMKQLVPRERENLTICRAELRENPTDYADFCKGEQLAMMEIKKCFE
ncbi:hypothetical protein F5884DRAFT_840975 [Xylogone sp. PMI_703]|nr:hypothetical protein F5884DRAFT_840975 [Xylogone sp. PMI_703]